MKSFLDTFFNFDSRIVHSLKDIWKPNKITKSFISGKRGYYLHPFRFFFICLVLFFGVFSIFMRDIDLATGNIDERIGKHEFFVSIDSMKFDSTLGCENAVLDSLKQGIPRSIRNLDKDTFFTGRVFGSNWSEYGISTYDAFKLSEEDFDKKYKIDKKIDSHLIHQSRRIIKSPASAIKYGIGNMLWGILLVTALIALLLKLLYIRHGSYYVEHLLHITNFHSLFLLSFAFLLLFRIITQFNWLKVVIAFSFPLAIVYLILSLKRYYNQGLFITLTKVIILLFGYIFALSLIFVIIAFFTVVIF
ncbi:MAG: DUF3667 domain-containing protein [Saprospiraceae bacterium]|nr:DUF3667 domain-containing protein [Bacteroidia bacterium]NNE15709.1 DUF3667 domain-containing protein [Saprospiraceae bacterium]